MANNLLKKRFAELERLARAAGLRPYDVHFVEVPPDVIWEVASYGLPTRYSHWSFGRCVTGDTYIYDTSGMREIRDVIEELNLDFDSQGFAESSIDIFDDEGIVRSSHAFKSKENCFKVSTDRGISITGTADHPLLTLRQGQLVWTKISELCVGDSILARMGSNIFGDLNKLNFQFTPHRYKVIHNHSYKNVKIPSLMTPELAFLMGVLSAEGTLTSKHVVSVSLANTEKQFQSQIISAFDNLFGVACDRGGLCPGNGIELKFHSTKMRQFLEYLGMRYETSCSKYVPWSILRSPRECVCAYLRGLFEGDGNVSSGSIGIGLCSSKIIRQVQLMLLNIGIVSTTKFDISIKPSESSVAERGTAKHWLWITGEYNLRKFKELIGFSSDEKNAKLNSACFDRQINKSDTRTYSELKPIIRQMYLASRNRKLNNRLKHAYQNALCYNPTADSLEVILENDKEQKEKCNFLKMMLNYVCLKVKSIEDVGMQSVYDFTIPRGHKFLGNGIVNHNSYQYQKTQGEMGYSKIYELIINNNPSIAYLDKNNTDTANLMIAAHCLSHSDFFANNIMFKQADEQQMIEVAKRHAEIIDQFRNDFGDDEVDEWLDVALSLERHIDVYNGYRRRRYPKRHVAYIERQRKPWEDVVPSNEPLVKKEMRGIHIPPRPEKDILWFLSEYSNLEPWQQKIFEIVRRESYYFYPQYRTKILNEGFASFWHAELMRQYAMGNDNDFGVTDIEHPLTAEEHLDFVALHEKVVQPGTKMRLKEERDVFDHQGRRTGRKIKTFRRELAEYPGLFGSATRINPYYVGFRILRDIQERWDKYYKQGYREDDNGNKIPVTINGIQKIFEVREQEDDVSFLRKYLTEEMCAELHLFVYGNTENYNDDYEIQEEIRKRAKSNDNLGEHAIDEQMIENRTIRVNTKDLKQVIAAFARQHNNYGAPQITIRRVDESGLLRLEHMPDDKVNLDITYAEHVLRYVYRAWRRPIELIRKDNKMNRTWIMTYDGLTFDIDHQTADYPECVENNDVPSSW